MNEFILFGKAVDKPDLQESSNGLKYCNLLLEVQPPFTNKEKELYRITCFKTVAEDCNNNIFAGSKLVIRGRLQDNNFTKEKDGEVVYRSELVGERFTYVD